MSNLDKILENIITRETHKGSVNRVRIQAKAAIKLELEKTLPATLRFSSLDPSSCPKWLLPKARESWEGAIRYEEGYNAALTEIRDRIKEL